MTFLSHLLFVATLAVLSLAACTGEPPCEGDTCAIDVVPDSLPELVRIEIEIVGEGTVFVDGPDLLDCSGDRALCSFSFARGTELVLRSDKAFSGSSEWQDACAGKTLCYLTLVRDEVVVANFDDESFANSQYAIELAEDNVIVDRNPRWNRS